MSVPCILEVEQFQSKDQKGRLISISKGQSGVQVSVISEVPDKVLGGCRMQKRVADAGAAPLVAPPAGSVPGYDIVAHPFNFDLTSGGKSVPGVGELIEASEDVRP